jgi:hypothetical protein
MLQHSTDSPYGSNVKEVKIKVSVCLLGDKGHCTKEKKRQCSTFSISEERT